MMMNNPRIAAIVSFVFVSMTLVGVCVHESKLKLLTSFYHNEKIRNDSILNKLYDIEYVIESIFTNQGYLLPKNIIFSNDSIKIDVADINNNIVFACVSPLSCWTCVKSINSYIESIGNKGQLIYVIPTDFSIDIQPFLEYTEIPLKQVCFMSSDLGVPIEKSNRMFLFTIEDGKLIKNVFPPTVYSHEITQVYFNSLLTK